MFEFIAATFLLIVTPGPGVLTTAGMGAAFGFRAGLKYVLGLAIGQLIVIALVVTGLSALLFAIPSIRVVLVAVSACYLIYLAAKIALSGAKISFIKSETAPGVLAGTLLQPINPKAYVVSTTLFSGYVIYADSFWTEVAIKLVLLHLIWVPIHLAWLFAGAILEQLNLAPAVQRGINIAMAIALLLVVGLAALSVR